MVQFIIDSAADIIPEEAKKYGMTHLPLKVIFGAEEYADSVNLTHYEFYKKLIEGDVHPSTSQVSPGEFEAAYEAVTANGDTAVVVTISGKLSGTYQSACIAAENYEGKVFVVDSENAAIGERILIQYGLQLRDQGLSAAAIAAELNDKKSKIRLFALLDTLEYLKRGGRISSTVAFAGALLSIKPVIAIEGGAVGLKGTARGTKRGYALLTDLVEKSGGIDLNKPFSLAYSGLTDEAVQKYMEENKELWRGRKKVPVNSVGCTIGVHVGPGAVALAYFTK